MNRDTPTDGAWPKGNKLPCFDVLENENKFEIYTYNTVRTQIDFDVDKTYHVMLQQYASNWIGDEVYQNCHEDNNQIWGYCEMTNGDYRFVIYVDCVLKYEHAYTENVKSFDPVYLQTSYPWNVAAFDRSGGTVENFLVGTTLPPLFMEVFSGY